MLNLNEWLWDTDVERFLNQTLTSRDGQPILDEGYFNETIELIDNGVSPIRKGQRLTRSELEEWHRRCTCKHQGKERQEYPRNADRKRIAYPTI